MEKPEETRPADPTAALLKAPDRRLVKIEHTSWLICAAGAAVIHYAGSAGETLRAIILPHEWPAVAAVSAYSRSAHWRKMAPQWSRADVFSLTKGSKWYTLGPRLRYVSVLPYQLSPGAVAFGDEAVSGAGAIGIRADSVERLWAECVGTPFPVL